MQITTPSERDPIDTTAVERIGKVWFVGAGPGAADPITVRGSRLLGEAAAAGESLTLPEVTRTVILASPALGARRQDGVGVSRLYDARFSHGFRPSGDLSLDDP